MSWYENDGLWSGFAGMMFSEKRAGSAHRNVADSPMLQFEQGSRVLDLCCGPGIYLVPLAEHGYTVTGVDLSPAMLDDARGACEEADVDVELVHGDMLEFARPAAFDVVVNMYSSFGYFDEQEKNMQVLRNIHSSLVPDGQLILEVFGKEFLASHDLGRPQVVDVDGDTVFVRNTILGDWSQLHTEWTKVHNNVVSTASIISHLYSAVELKSMVERAGFTDVECFGGFDGRPYDLRAKTLIVRATRGPDSPGHPQLCMNSELLARTGTLTGPGVM